MTVENQNRGSEYGIEKRIPGIADWTPITTPGIGFETYEEAYQKALNYAKVRSEMSYSYTIEFRVVVYDYDGSKRKNIRILTIVTELEPWVAKAVDEMIDITPTGEDEK